MAGVQVELVHFAVLYLFGALAAFRRWRQRADCALVKDSGGAGVNVGVDQAAVHTFTCWCWEAPGAVGLTEESPGAQQLQPGFTHVRGIL